MDRPTVEQIQHFFRLMEKGLVTRQNFQRYLKGLSHPVEGINKEEIIEQSSSPSITLASEFIPEGWSVAVINGVLQDVAPSTFNVAGLRPRQILRDGDNKLVNGEEMRILSVESEANWGLADGKRMLAEQSTINVEFRGFYIPLPGTVLLDPGGSLHIACLYWDGDLWSLRFRWLILEWGVVARLACGT